jgi:hypothetical protein
MGRGGDGAGLVPAELEEDDGGDGSCELMTAFSLGVFNCQDSKNSEVNL